MLTLFLSVIYIYVVLFIWYRLVNCYQFLHYNFKITESLDMLVFLFSGCCKSRNLKSQRWRQMWYWWRVLSAGSWSNCFLWNWKFFYMSNSTIPNLFLDNSMQIIKGERERLLPLWPSVYSSWKGGSLEMGLSAHQHKRGTHWLKSIDQFEKIKFCKLS